MVKSTPTLHAPQGKSGEKPGVAVPFGRLQRCGTAPQAKEVNAVNILQEVNLSWDDLTIAGRLAWLDRGIGHSTAAVDGPFYGAFLAPLKDNTGAVRDKVLDDLSVADYDGAEPQPLTWSPAAVDETGESYVLASRAEFVPTGDDTLGSQLVTGVALIGSDSVTLLGARDLDTAVEVKFAGPVALRVDTTLDGLPPLNRG